MEERKIWGIIYKITNKKNNKVYIGQTINSFKKRYPDKGVGIERVYNHHLHLKERKRAYNER